MELGVSKNLRGAMLSAALIGIPVFVEDWADGILWHQYNLGHDECRGKGYPHIDASQEAYDKLSSGVLA